MQTQIWEKFRDRGVIVLGLSGSGLFGTESRATVEAFREQTGTTFPLLLGDRSYRGYGAPDGAISPFPLDVIVGPDGTIEYLRREFDGDAMAATLESLLAREGGAG